MTKQTKDQQESERALKLQAAYEKLVNILMTENISYLEMLGILEISKTTVMKQIEFASSRVYPIEAMPAKKEKIKPDYIG